MLMVANVAKSICRKLTDEEQHLSGIERLGVRRSKIPAVTHVDYSARIQTVHKETNPKFYSLINEFKRLNRLPYSSEHFF